MSIYEYDQEREFALIRRDEREIGEKIGREKALKQVAQERKNTERILQEEKENSIRLENALQKEKESSIQSIIALCEEFGSSKDIIVEKLMEQCHLTKEQAQEKLTLYEDRKQKGELDR